MIRDDDALEYHSSSPPGKIAIKATKPCLTQRDLSLAYTPGVAVPCLEIHRDPNLVYKYTAKANLVAVVTNGTAVLGLGNIGPAAGKPVMEGKAVLFKRFADIDVFDIELATEDPKEIIRVCQLLEPTFGGINLEDIKAPECFEIEEELRRTLNIPVFHDDQHGTAIISGAALLNALEIAGKQIDQVRVVFNGAGAAAIACAEHYIKLGVRRENVILCDTKGVVFKGRTEGMNRYKARFAVETELRTLADAFRAADVFFGLSAGNCVTPEMLLAMAENPIVFALANPDPEIPYSVAVQTRSDLIMATGRSDFPNQVNNVLGFPSVFRGALDVRATIVDPAISPRLAYYIEELYKIRQRKGVTRKEAEELIVSPNVFGSMIVHLGDADAMISGLTHHYPETIRPALQIIAMRKGVGKVSGLYLLLSPRGKLYFLADCTVNIEPTAEELAEIAICAAEMARRFDVEPSVAFLSFSNFGSTQHPSAEKMKKAVEIVRQREPSLMVDGEMQADTAVVPEIIQETYPFSLLQGGANVLIFPSLEAGNIAYKLLARIGGAQVIGPVLMGLSKPVHVLQRGAEVSDIVNMVAVAVVEAQEVPDSRKKAEARLMKRMLAPNSRDHLKSPVPETI